MNIEDLISQYIDGSLSAEMEAELHHRLAVSPEARALFRSHIMLRGLARDQRVLHAPSQQMRSSLFDRLHREEGMSAIASASSSVPAALDAGVTATGTTTTGTTTTGTTAAGTELADRPSRRPDRAVDAPRRRRRIAPWLIPLAVIAVMLLVFLPTSDNEQVQPRFAVKDRVWKNPAAAAPTSSAETSAAIENDALADTQASASASSHHEHLLADARPMSGDESVGRQEAVEQSQGLVLTEEHSVASDGDRSEFSVNSRASSDGNGGGVRAAKKEIAAASSDETNHRTAAMGRSYTLQTGTSNGPLARNRGDNDRSHLPARTLASADADRPANSETQSWRNRAANTTAMSDASVRSADSSQAPKTSSTSMSKAELHGDIASNDDNTSGYYGSREAPRSLMPPSAPARAADTVGTRRNDVLKDASADHLADDRSRSKSDGDVDAPSGLHAGDNSTMETKQTVTNTDLAYKMQDPGSLGGSGSSGTAALDPVGGAPEHSAAEGEANGSFAQQSPALEDRQLAFGQAAPPPPPPPPPAVMASKSALGKESSRKERDGLASSTAANGTTITAKEDEPLASGLLINTAVDSVAPEKMVAEGKPITSEPLALDQREGGNMLPMTVSIREQRGIHVGVQQNTLANVSTWELNPDVAARIGLDFADGGQQFFVLLGVATYRSVTADSVTAVWNGVVVSTPMPTPVTVTNDAKVNELWLAVGYRVNLVDGEHFSMDLGGWIGAGQRYGRAAVEFPIVWKITRIVRIELIPMLQGMSAFPGATTTTVDELDTSQPSSERHVRRSAPKHDAPITPGLGVGVSALF